LIPQSRQFTQVSKISQYQALLADPKRLAWLETESDLVKIHLGDIRKEDAVNTYHQQHDLIVLVNSETLLKTDADRVLRNAIKFLTPEGRIMFVDNSIETDIALTMNYLKLSQEVQLNFSTHRGTQTRLITAKLQRAVAEKPSEIVLLEAPNPSTDASNIAQEVIESLHIQGISVQRQSWPLDPLLLRRKACISLIELTGPLLETLSSSDFQYLQNMLLEGTDLLWISADDSPAGCLMSGVVRTIHNEAVNARCRTLQLDKESTSTVGSIVCYLLTSALKDVQLRVMQGVLHSSRVEPNLALDERVLSSTKSQAIRITTRTFGQLPTAAKLMIQRSERLQLVCLAPDRTLRDALLPGEVEIEVRASGIASLEKLATSFSHELAENMEFECAGIVRHVASDVVKFTVGDRVVTYGHGPQRSVYRASEALCAKIPDGIEFEAAAMVSSMYGAAWYGIVKIAQAEPGQSILIQASSRAAAKSTVMLARYLNLVVYIMDESDEEEQDIWGDVEIPDTNVFKTRGSIVKKILEATQGQGVDIVFKSFSSKRARETWGCLTAFGTILDVVHHDDPQRTRTANISPRKDCVYASYSIHRIAATRPKVMADIVKNVFALLGQGAITPVSPVRTVLLSQAISECHSGQKRNDPATAVLTWATDDRVPTTGFTTTQVLNADGVYLLVGGLGGIGRSLAKLLIELGARKLCFLSRSGASTKPAQAFMNGLRHQNVHAMAYACDVSDATATQQAIQRCTASLGPVRGVVQAAMSLQDALFANMTHTQWVNSLRPKVNGTRNLHDLLPSDLDFFVMLSSFAGIFGNRGQANYAAACNYQDSFAHFRRKQGLRGVSIDLGIVRDVGVLAETEGTNKLKTWETHFGIRERELHGLMRAVIEHEVGNEGGITTGSIDAQIVTGFATAADLKRVGLEAPYYFSEPRFSILAATTGHDEAALDSSGAESKSTNVIKATLSTVQTLPDAAKLVTDAIVDWLATKLQTIVAEIDQSRSLHTYGVDSLLAVEVTQWVFQRFRATITVFELLAAVPITSLAQKIAEKSTDLPAELKPKSA
jgi:NADPH:quinone reductase-like Zn-dependent oxidoreductase/NAD(P)-dependent dehydrogenase (short-subunit alcohol dehydrogenase family)/acyl carrier protein